MRAVLLVFCILLFPALSHAALNAGVVNGVWFSNDAPDEGEPVTIYTAVQNTSGESIVGTVGFLVDGDIVGSAHFTAPSNDIVSVSLSHTFPSGTHEVSAYITSVENESVAYTTVPKVKITVTDVPDASEETSESESSSAKAGDIASSVTHTVTNTGKDAITKVEPLAESTAQRIESFRDTLIAATSSGETQENDVGSADAPAGFVAQKKQVAKDFWTESKDIATSSETPIWKRAAALLLSTAAFLVRFWFVFVVLGVGFVFWLLVRGRRII